MSLSKFAGLGALVLVAAVGVGPTRAQTFTEQGAAILAGVNFDSRSASFADIDGDRDLDLFFQGGGTGAQKLFRNNFVGSGVMTFTDISTLLPSGLGPSWSAAWGDYNGDRRVDVFVGQSNIGASGDVLRNNGAAGFSNESVPTGLNDPGFHQNVAWNDIDNDRDLDLIIGMEGPEKHEIYLQGPPNQFTPVGAASGFQQLEGTRGYGMAIGDTDDDGDLDIYISTCRPDNNVRNNFYQNRLIETGSLNFVDIADTNGTQYMTNSYGAEFQDFNNDGRLDLFLVGADGLPSKIYRNNGGNQFTDVDTITGHPLLSDTAGDLNGAKAVDYDNDGDLDLFFHDHLPRAGRNEARKLYRNDGNWQFTDVTAASGLAATNQGAYDSTWGDIDLDGDMDLIAPTDINFAERVFRNNASQNGNHWLHVKLVGSTDNTTGIGTKLFATLNDGTPQEVTLRREANTNAGTFNQSDLPVHFGLGAAATIDQLRIVWPDGSVRILQDVAVDRYLVVSILPCDLDLNGLCNLTDINSLLAAGPIAPGVVVTPGINDRLDLTGDGVIDLDDLTDWLATAAVENGFASTYKRGDANLDGVVDGSDFNLWNGNKFTNSLAWNSGNFNGDQVVDGSDFNLWNVSKFTSSDRVSSVPEVAGSWIALWGALAWIVRRGSAHRHRLESTAWKAMPTRG